MKKKKYKSKIMFTLKRFYILFIVTFSNSNKLTYRFRIFLGGTRTISVVNFFTKISLQSGKLILENSLFSERLGKLQMYNAIVCYWFISLWNDNYKIFVYVLRSFDMYVHIFLTFVEKKAENNQSYRCTTGINDVPKWRTY